MIFSIDKSIPLLQNTPLVIHHLLNQLSNEWVLANEGADTWNVKEIIAHLIVCEETDWMKRATNLPTCGNKIWQHLKNLIYNRLN